MTMFIFYFNCCRKMNKVVYNSNMVDGSYSKMEVVVSQLWIEIFVEIWFAVSF